MKFTLLITAPAFGSQGAHSAYHFCKAALTKGQTIAQIFFYSAGVYNANQVNTLPVDEINLVELWQTLAKQYGIKLYVCVAAAQRRGIEEQQTNFAKGFSITGLGQLIESIDTTDRFIIFN